MSDDGQYTPRQGADEAPANQVTWKGAVLFCVWLSETTGKKYRLPTEAEWELAARGVEERSWPWGDELPTEKHGFRYDYDALAYNSAILADRTNRNEPTWTTASVGSYPANATPEGVHDLLAYIIGEWCTNKYVERPTPEQMINSQFDLEDVSTHRVVRGYYHRHRSGVLSIGSMPHLGRPWTRIDCHPIRAAQNAARHGFRVVEEFESTTSL